MLRRAQVLMFLPLLVTAALAAQQAPRRYTGEPISLNLKDVSLHDFFRLMHEISGLNVVLDPAVRGSLTLAMNFPWDQALDVVLRNHGLLSELEGNVVRIMTRETARREQEERRALAQAVEAAGPRQTAIHTLSYARASAVAPTLRRFLSPRGEILVDERTNSLILTDVPAVLKHILGATWRQPSSPEPLPQPLPGRHTSDSPWHNLALKGGTIYGVYSCQAQQEWLRYHTVYGARARVPLTQVEWARTNCTAAPAGNTRP